MLWTKAQQRSVQESGAAAKMHEARGPGTGGGQGRGDRSQDGPSQQQQQQGQQQNILADMQFLQPIKLTNIPES